MWGNKLAYKSKDQCVTEELVREATRECCILKKIVKQKLQKKKQRASQRELLRDKEDSQERAMRGDEKYKGEIKVLLPLIEIISECESEEK